MISPFLEQLFFRLTPTYNPTFMLELVLTECANLTPATLEVQIAEFLKFAYLYSLYHQEVEKTFFVPVKKAIDEIWHLFIVQTREYECFCQALPGKIFLHHTTIHLEEYGKIRDKSQLVESMMRWVPRYCQNFGPFTEETAQYWMMPGFLQEVFKLSLEEINALK